HPRSAVLLERVGPRRAEDRPAARQDATHLRDTERATVALEGTSPAVAVTEELVPVISHALTDDRPDHGVQSRAVASTGEHADPHLRSIYLPRVGGPSALRSRR